MLKKVLLGAALASLPIVAQAETASDTSPIGVRIENRTLSLTNTAGMNFGLVMPFSEDGTITINSTNGGAIISNLLLVDATGFSRASFLVEGIPNAPFALTLPAQAIISNGVETMLVDNFFRNSGSGISNTLNSSGLHTMFIGARLNVAGRQAPGDYTGQFEVTVNYL